MPLHLLVAHFPFALILVGAGGDLAGVIGRSERLRSWSGTLLMLGALFALLALLTGGDAASQALSQPRPPYALIDVHSQWAGAAIWPIAGAGVLRALWRDRLSGIHGFATLAAGLISAALIVGISISGMAIRHG